MLIETAPNSYLPSVQCAQTDLVNVTAKQDNFLNNVDGIKETYSGKGKDNRNVVYLPYTGNLTTNLSVTNNTLPAVVINITGNSNNYAIEFNAVSVPAVINIDGSLNLNSYVTL